MTATIVKARAWTNEQSTRFRFESWRPGDPLGNPVDLEIWQDDSDYGALDKIWAIGNREAMDAGGKVWPSTVRSLSVGDVIALQMSGGRQFFWAIAPAGFESLPYGYPCDCGKGDLCPQYGIRFAPAPAPPTRESVGLRP